MRARRSDELTSSPAIPGGPRASTSGLRQLGEQEEGARVQAKFLTGARNVGKRDKLRTQNEELKAKLRVAEEERGVLAGELGKFRDRESLITETWLAPQACRQRATGACGDRFQGGATRQALDLRREVRSLPLCSARVLVGLNSRLPKDRLALLLCLFAQLLGSARDLIER
jgi:hypothetical protein